MDSGKSFCHASFTGCIGGLHSWISSAGNSDFMAGDGSLRSWVFTSDVDGGLHSWVFTSGVDDGLRSWVFTTGGGGLCSRLPTTGGGLHSRVSSADRDSLHSGVFSAGWKTACIPEALWWAKKAACVPEYYQHVEKATCEPEALPMPKLIYESEQGPCPYLFWCSCPCLNQRTGPCPYLSQCQCTCLSQSPCTCPVHASEHAHEQTLMGEKKKIQAMSSLFHYGKCKITDE